MRALLALACATALSACVTTAPVEPLPALAKANASYKAVCGEVRRLKREGVDLPAARNGCVTASDILDGADVAYRAGRLVEATDGAQRALIYLTAAQAAVAALGIAK